MSSYKRYPAYKDSGVEWLGDLPEHWEVNLLNRGYTVTLGKMLQPEERSDKDDLVPYLRAANIQWSGVDVSDVKNMWLSAHERRNLSLRPGDLLVSEGGDVGRCAIWRNELPECYFQNSINRIRNRKSNNVQFLYYWIQSVKQGGFIDILCHKSTIAHFTAEKVAALPVPFPPINEQDAIAAFLNRETARIDALIAKKTRFIELLREKRQALITRAVTKGVDPDVPMKDSGVEWLGEVPEHWGVTTIRRISIAVQTGGTPPEVFSNDQLEDGVMWFTPGDFDGSLCLTISAKKISNKTIASGDAKIFAAGSVLIVSIGATLGKVGLAKFPSSANQQINAVTPNSRADVHFLAYSLSVKEDVMRFLSNSSTIGIMNQDKTKEIWLALPPNSEQTAITNFLDRETARIDALVKKTERSISLLQEKRSALITAVVTGQIDAMPAVEFPRYS